MTTYDAITAGEIAVDAPITNALMTALRDNPTAISEGATNAPVPAGVWHPYDMVNIGDGNDGVIYDFSVNGTQATIDTPTFDAGYEYRLIGTDLRASSSGNGQLYLNDGSWNLAWTTGAAFSSTDWDFVWEIDFPALSRVSHLGLVRSVITSTNELDVTEIDIGASTITAARIDHSAGNYNSGKVYLERRLNPLTK